MYPCADDRMKYDPKQHHRRSIRLRGYDYSLPGAYFITICIHHKQCLLGEIVEGQMHRNTYGEIVQEEWFRSATIRKEIQLDAWMVMPNHVHGIVKITPVGAHGHAPHDDSPQPFVTPGVGAHGHVTQYGAPPQRRQRSLATFVGGFKSAVKVRINYMRGTPGLPVWQSNYYEHVVRDEDELDKIREYILTNPVRWRDDRENPEHEIGARDIGVRNVGAHGHAPLPDW
jgi:putative transposase